MKKFKKKIKITPADIISVIFLLIFLLVFGRLAFPAEPSSIEWRQAMSEEIIIAYADYLKAIDENFTDTGCETAAAHFDRKINFILSKYNNLITRAIGSPRKRIQHFNKGEN